MHRVPAPGWQDKIPKQIVHVDLVYRVSILDVELVAEDTVRGDPKPEVAVVHHYRLGSGRIQMSPVYPIEVAMELGNMVMVQLLLEAGATYPTMEWKTWICSWLGTKDGLGARRSHLKDDRVLKPLRSCLVGDRTNEMMQGNHGASDEKSQTGKVVSVHL